MSDPVSTAPLLRVEGLTKVFGSGRTEVVAVRDVDLGSDRGEITLVMGPSGSGKTTLLTMIGCLLRPTSGRIELDGVDVTALPPREHPRIRRSLVGFVFQTFNLLDALSARENVQVALDIGGMSGPAAAERARRLLGDAGLEERLDFPASGLSAGERQRVAIARALANDPPLLLADEPTANLDSRHGRDVMRLLRALAERRGCGALVVSHDERLRSIADRVVLLEDGRIVSIAEPARPRRFRSSPPSAIGVESDGEPERRGHAGAMHVRDLMTREVVTVGPDLPLKEVAAVLDTHRIAGVPVCDEEGHVLGVVSEADILWKELGLEGAVKGVVGAILEKADGKNARIKARTAGEAMTAPALTVAPNAMIAQAARLMIEKRVNRLPVVEDGRLVGIVARSDLVHAFTRTDEELRHEIVEDVLVHTLWVDPDSVAVTVVDGDVAMSGRVENRTTAELVESFVRRIPGVVSLTADLTWTVDDLAARGTRASHFTRR